MSTCPCSQAHMSAVDPSSSRRLTCAPQESSARTMSARPGGRTWLALALTSPERSSCSTALSSPSDRQAASEQLSGVAGEGVHVSPDHRHLRHLVTGHAQPGLEHAEFLYYTFTGTAFVRGDHPGGGTEVCLIFLGFGVHILVHIGRLQVVRLQAEVGGRLPGVEVWKREQFGRSLSSELSLSSVDVLSSEDVDSYLLRQDIRRSSEVAVGHGRDAALRSDQGAHLHNTRLLQRVHLDTHSPLVPLLGLLGEADQHLQAVILGFLPADTRGHERVLWLKAEGRVLHLLLSLEILHSLLQLVLQPDHLTPQSICLWEQAQVSLADPDSDMPNTRPLLRPDPHGTHLPLNPGPHPGHIFTARVWLGATVRLGAFGRRGRRQPRGLGGTLGSACAQLFFGDVNVQLPSRTASAESQELVTLQLHTELACLIFLSATAICSLTCCRWAGVGDTGVDRPELMGVKEAPPPWVRLKLWALLMEVLEPAMLLCMLPRLEKRRPSFSSSSFLRASSRVFSTRAVLKFARWVLWNPGAQ
ncbi:hypothetical protein CRUP_016133 [Coryphaenoides rupestris]|nr:hypothetical protein CRUP_016133 [Coryphaenoides rupestris]